MGNVWHYELRGAQLGPVSGDWIRQEIALGSLSTATLVWTAGMPQWSPAHTIPEFNMTPPPTPQHIASSQAVQADTLTSNEYVWYTLAFVFIPFVNVLVSSILYYSWRAAKPTRANQINRLGWIVFGCQFALSILINFGAAALGSL